MGRKTLWEKEELLVTSNFSFSHSVFKRLALQTFKIQGLFGKGLITDEKFIGLSKFEAGANNELKNVVEMTCL